ncbi:MAG: thioredoxin family protein [Planctomycetes bacterium]|nr:thioredoxin family protein [Planctomycetota bacterium]
MKRHGTWIPTLIVCSAIAFVIGPTTGSAFAQEKETNPQEPAKKPVYDEAADAHVDIANALKKAKKENRRVLIQWGANWCGWCTLLDGAFKSDRNISRKLMYEYDLVHVDIGKWDKHLDLVEKYGADIKNTGVPYLTILDGDGKVIANQDTGSLELKGDGESGHDLEKVLNFLTEHQAAYRKASDIFEEGLARAKKDHKRVFLHFGAPWCGWCHRLENWMAQPEIAKILAKEFVDIKIDEDRTIGGRDLEAKLREGESAGIPWFAILNAEGETLVTSDGPKGNVGFPVADHEVGYFMEMLQKHTENLTDDDIATLETSLKAIGKKLQEGSH